MTDQPLQWTRKDGYRAENVELGDWSSQLTPGVGDARIHGIPHGVLSRQFEYPSATVRGADEVGDGPRLPFSLGMMDLAKGVDSAPDIGPTTDPGSKERVYSPADFGIKHVERDRAKNTGMGEFVTPEGATVRGDDVDRSRDTLKYITGNDPRKSPADVDFANATGNAQSDFYSLMARTADNNAWALSNLGRIGERMMGAVEGAGGTEDFTGPEHPDPIKALDRNAAFRSMQNPN